MNRQRTLLQEYTKDPKAIKEARSEPIPEAVVDRSLSFLRAIVLDLPFQTGELVESTPNFTEMERAVMEGGHSLEEKQEQMAMLKKLAGLK
jgi:hypothetical protein